MCGIAGYAGDPNRADACERVARMVASMARRGPDGEGMESWESAVLGHRRLSIFDLSDAGRQPMLLEDGSVGLVFNGAIYNFLELRAELEQAGHRFRSRSDTEVILRGYREWGIDRLVGRMRGMFAFGLWDNQRRKLFLVRDRLGVKPLVYAERNGAIAFASTVRALYDGGFVHEIDDEAMAEYLEFGYVTDGRAIYRGAAKLPAAHILEWSDGTCQKREYWKPSAARAADACPFESAVEETERLFLQAVKLRLEADVPVGALLSGGIDSALVCWAIAKLGGDIRAFTIGTPGDPQDETSDAVATARELKIDHCVIETRPEDAPTVEELVSAYGEPFACASALGMLRVSRAVKPHATVLLTGDGGDDVFLGYPEHKHFRAAQRLSSGIPRDLGELWPAVRKWLPHRRARHFLDYAMGGLGAVTHAHDGWPVYQREGLLGERLADVSVAQRSIPWSVRSGRNLLADFLAYDRQTRFVGEYLTKVDGGAMHCALEARSPFLDQELWNFAASLPFDVRLHGGRLKAVLRELARRRVSERVANGVKRGFNIPVQGWLVGSWRGAFELAMRDSVLGREGFLRPERALATLASASALGQAPNQLWYIFVLETWLRQASGKTEGRAAGLPPCLSGIL